MSASGDDFMGMAAAAVALKNVFDAYVAAGFTERQAMEILRTLLTSMQQGAAS